MSIMLKMPPILNMMDIRLQDPVKLFCVLRRPHRLYISMIQHPRSMGFIAEIIRP